jgi:hypothetical protein
MSTLQERSQAFEAFARKERAPIVARQAGLKKQAKTLAVVAGVGLVAFGIYHVVKG